MKCEPNFPDYVIVLVKVNNSFHWYVTEKELWILNLLKLDNAFRKKMNEPIVDETVAEDERRGFELLDETNILDFMKVIKDFKVDSQELIDYYKVLENKEFSSREILKKISFFIDFDKKCFYSFFLEPGSYEEYIPKGWDGILSNDIGKFL
ncbi:hypothetical protein [Lysinibacillus parviboronicapiens]|uniref:hypothetical protein n=1 Tax=Lysinibacillus parviboronicapiens TaxID=436516 RepID=UPI000D386EE3|nr:hypothetical protein [Lysinibacillus parviboronicapiens]